MFLFQGLSARSVSIGSGAKFRRVKDMAEQKKGYFHVIREKYCKGCGICIALCPKQLLVLKNGKVFPEHPEICIGCRMCEYRCPDFAIEVKPLAVERVNGADAAAFDLSLPPEAQNG